MTSGQSEYTKPFLTEERAPPIVVCRRLGRVEKQVRVGKQCSATNTAVFAAERGEGKRSAGPSVRRGGKAGAQRRIEKEMSLSRWPAIRVWSGRSKNAEKQNGRSETHPGRTSRAEKYQERHLLLLPPCNVTIILVIQVAIQTLRRHLSRQYA